MRLPRYYTHMANKTEKGIEMKTLTPFQKKMETFVMWLSLPIVLFQYGRDTAKRSRNKANR